MLNSKGETRRQIGMANTPRINGLALRTAAMVESEVTQTQIQWGEKKSKKRAGQDMAQLQ